MNETLLTVSLLVIVLCNLGVLYLYFRIDRWMQTPEDIYGLLHLVLDRLSHVADRQRSMKQALLDDGQKTRKDIQEVKTRLTWSRKRELADAKREGAQSWK